MAYFKTIVVSDVHLGTVDAKSRELAKFLKYNHSRRLILNGDIIDAWHLNHKGKWKKKDTRVFRRILEMIERHNTQVIYVRGNHDDFLDKMIPIVFGNIKIVDHFELVSKGRKYFVTHGDLFDVVSSRFTWLARVGDIGYKFLLWINRRHNKRRALRGLPYDSVSQKIKNRVKLAVSYISDFEQVMVDYVKMKGYTGIICGHIHKPENKIIDNVHYLNSGDWVETMSALVEDEEGNWQVIYYDTLIPDEQTTEVPDEQAREKIAVEF
ncbi:MAG: UDP-2,3-diacylglucosamine diphosphatase [Bacteroidales bacterium]